MFPLLPALIYAVSPTFANVIVVEPTVNVFHVEPSSVEYSKETEGAEPTAYIAIVEFAYFASKLKQAYGFIVQPLGIALIPVVVSLPL